jgi:small subunit ribosomal protein S1
MSDETTVHPDGAHPEAAPHAEVAVQEETNTAGLVAGEEAVTEPEAQGTSTPHDLGNLYDESFRRFEEGEIVKGTVIHIRENEVVVDVGFKSEGIIPIEEFRAADGSLQVKVGDKVEVFLEETEDSDGYVVLSKEKADKAKVWEDLNKLFTDDQEVEGRVIERVKGGLAVDVGVRAFLPGSQIDIRPVHNLEPLLGQKIKVKILKLNRMRNNVVVSRRVILEKDLESKRQTTLSRLQVGATMKGVVKNITEYGAFIDLGGVDGLLHITDMAWGRISHPSEMLMVGDEIEVMVLKFDPDTKKVSLGLKQKTADPWKNIVEKYPVGTKVKGKVVSLTDYGAFVELEEGVEGLIHVSEMSWTRKVKHPSKILAVGDNVEAMILDVNTEKKRLSLGLKQLEPNPWDLLLERFPVGSVVTGKVRNMTDFGVFVGLDEGIDGLVHISDISWTKKIKHPSDTMKKGDKVQAKVLHVDRERERLSLGIKQLTPDPWDTVSVKYAVGQDVTGKVLSVTDFGAFVELEDGIEGLIHISELSRTKVARAEDVVKEGDDVVARIIKIDPSERKLALSIKAREEGAERTDISSYMDRTDHGAMTLGMLGVGRKEKGKSRRKDLYEDSDED